VRRDRIRGRGGARELDAGGDEANLSTGPHGGGIGLSIDRRKRSC
jgi:hypothetical protein